LILSLIKNLNLMQTRFELFFAFGVINEERVTTLEFVGLGFRVICVSLMF
jgi:hypothetical protein